MQTTHRRLSRLLATLDLSEHRRRPPGPPHRPRFPRVRGGRTSWTNVVLACGECNRKKGALDIQDKITD